MKKTPQLHRLGEEVRGPDLAPLSERSVPAALAARARLEPARVAVRFRNPAGRMIDLTWQELDDRRRALAAGLAGLGVGPGDRVAVLSANSAEMLLSELAVLTLGAASVPLFPESSAEVLLHCLGDCGARVALAGSAVQQRRLAAARGLERVVVLDDQPLPDDPRALSLRALETAGREARLELPDPGPDDLAFLLYTGGTTGRPKGVELTHASLLAEQAAMAAAGLVTEADVFLAYLPWHHTFGALFERFLALFARAVLVVDDSRGRDLDRLLANLAEVKPTVYFGVPRVYQALAARAARDPAAREAVFGGRLRFVFTAAAPLGDLAFSAFESNGVPVLSGWGLTEASPITLTNLHGPRAAGSVGWPLPGVSIRLEAAAQPGHPAVGEAWVKGPQLMRGYHRLPDDTAAALRDGWLRTGDLAEWTPEGLRLFGRVDGVFKLENGEKVSAGAVEARLLAATPLIEHCVVLGMGQPFVTALCFVAQGPARRALEDLGLDVPSTLDELTRVPELRRAIVEALRASNLLVQVPYERVRRVALVPSAPDAAAGELTPTLRLVRAVSGELRADLVKALQEDELHPQVVEVFRKDAFEHA